MGVPMFVALTEPETTTVVIIRAQYQEERHEHLHSYTHVFSSGLTTLAMVVGGEPLLYL